MLQALSDTQAIILNSDKSSQMSGRKRKGNLVCLYTSMNTSTGSGSIVPIKIILGIRWRRVVSLMPWPINSRENAPGTHGTKG
jgi:hypothetical protein